MQINARAGVNDFFIYIMDYNIDRNLYLREL